MDVIFSLSLALLIYIYMGYPVLIYVLKFLYTKPVRYREDFLPKVSLIISAYNEEKVIGQKIKNTLSLNYPAEKLSVWVVSDASEDRTDEIVLSFDDERVHLHRIEGRKGKTFGITKLMAKLQTEIVVFSDANAFYDRNAIRELVKFFADPQVGYVVGHAKYLEDFKNQAAVQETTYWSFEVWLKKNESAISSVVGGDGAIYAIRRELFIPLKPEDINDFVNPIQIILQGYRGVFNPHALCYEEASPSFIKEFRRKRRIVNRSWRGLWKNIAVMNPFRTGIFAWQIFSHKFLRWLAGIFLMGLYVSNWFIVARHPFFEFTLVAQTLFHLLALFGYLRNRRGESPGFWLNLPFYFDLVNFASTMGIWDALRGEKYTVWKTIRQE